MNKSVTTIQQNEAFRITCSLIVCAAFIRSFLGTNDQSKLLVEMPDNFLPLLCCFGFSIIISLFDNKNYEKSEKCAIIVTRNILILLTVLIIFFGFLLYDISRCVVPVLTLLYASFVSCFMVIRFIVYLFIKDLKKLQESSTKNKV